jgi:hypothetical protein
MGIALLLVGVVAAGGHLGHRLLLVAAAVAAAVADS